MRFEVIEGSASGHCCFEASVIDTESEFRDAICECFERQDAERIAATLNAAENRLNSVG